MDTLKAPVTLTISSGGAWRADSLAFAILTPASGNPNGALALGPARLQLAHAYASTGDGTNALREYARAAELMPEDDAAQIKAGNFMLLAGQYADAQGVAQRLLARKPDNVDAQILLANGHAGLKDLDGAIAAFEDALAIDPGNLSTHEYLGEGYVAAGRMDLARIELARLETLCGTGCEQYAGLAAAIAGEPENWGGR